ncbi:MAG: hypothetical protein ABJE95_12410 [Byssovorax sp.]
MNFFPPRARLVRFAHGAACTGATLFAAWIAGCGGSTPTGSSTSGSTATSTAEGASSSGGTGGSATSSGESSASTSGSGGAGGSSSSASSSSTASSSASSSSSGTGGGGAVGVIVTAAGHPVSLAVDASGLYWSDSITGDVKKAALDGSGVVTLAAAAAVPADFRGLSLGVTDVYLAVAPPSPGAIRKLPKAGGAVTDAASTPSATVLTSLNGVAYWGDSAGGSIVRIGSTLIYGIWTPTTIAADPSGIYWTEDTINVVRTVSLDGAKVSTLATMSPGAELGGVANGLVYYSLAGTIKTVPTTGGAAPTDLLLNANPHFLTVTTKGLYWVEDAPAGMPRPVKALPTGAMMPVDVGTATETSGLAVGQGYVYWSSGIDGTITREPAL